MTLHVLQCVSSTEGGVGFAVGQKSGGVRRGL